jgi:hypothetical protein
MLKKKTKKKSSVKLAKKNEKIAKINWKKIVYVILTIFLGKMLAFLVFEIISINFVGKLESLNLPVEYNQIFWLVYSPLSPYLFWIFIALGAVSGFFVGLAWWRIIYIEHRHWRNKKVSLKK